MMAELTSARDDTSPDQKEKNQWSDTLATPHPKREHLLRRRRRQLPGLSTLLQPVVLLSHKSVFFRPPQRKSLYSRKSKDPVFNVLFSVLNSSPHSLRKVQRRKRGTASGMGEKTERVQQSKLRGLRFHPAETFHVQVKLDERALRRSAEVTKKFDAFLLQEKLDVPSPVRINLLKWTRALQSPWVRRGCPASTESARCKQEHGHLHWSTIPEPASTRPTSPRLTNHMVPSPSSSFPREGKLVASEEEKDRRRERDRERRETRNSDQSAQTSVKDSV